MKKFFVEKLNPSDDTFKITDIYINSNSYVEKGELILSLESSKADIDIESENSGFLYFNVKKGDNINVGELFYIISEKEIKNPEKYFKIQNSSTNKDFMISNKANYLLEKYKIKPELIDKKIIKENDVLDYIKNSKNNSLVFDANLVLPNDKNKTSLVILGAGGGAKMCIDALNNSEEFKIVGILDDDVSLGVNVLGIPVVGNLNSIDNLLEISISNFIIAFGVLNNRQNRYNKFLELKDRGCCFPNIIHPKAVVENSVKMGSGNVVLAGANIGSSVVLGDLNYINNNSLVSHDCTLKNNIHIAPSAVLASSIIIESHVLIGMNSTLYYGINIGENSTILNGLIINSNIENNIIQKNNKL